MELNLLHLSDIHTTAGGDLYGEVDGIARIRELKHRLLDDRIRADAVLVTGDIIDRTSPQALGLALEELGDLAGALHAPLLPAAGNHDVVAAESFTGLLAERYYARRIGGLRVVVLDSSSGRLGEEQLIWLREELRSRPCPALGTILCLHHSPLASPLSALEGKGLQNPGDLRRVVEGSDVRLILTGHYHHVQSGSLGTLPVWTGPALSYQQILRAGPRAPAGGTDAPGYALLRIDAEGWSATPFPLSDPAPRLFGDPAGLHAPIIAQR